MGLLSTIKDRVIKKRQSEGRMDWVVEISNGFIVSTDFQKKTTRMLIKDIEMVEIETNPRGPWGCDFWWRIIGAGTVVWIPNVAGGESELILELSDWVGFDESLLEKAKASKKNESFLLWSKF